MNLQAKMMVNVVDGVVGYYSKIVDMERDERIQKHVPQFITTLRYSADTLRAGGYLSEAEVGEALLALEAFMRAVSSEKFSYDKLKDTYKRMLIESNREVR